MADIDKKLLKEIKEYCELNKLKIDTFINHLLKDAFMKEKYGERPLVIQAPFTRVIEEPKEEVISVPFVQFADDVTAQTIGNYEYTSATTAVYEEKEVPNEYHEKIKVEPKTNKSRKRKL